jgi:hypothetical protein
MKHKTVLALPHNQWLGERTDGIYAELYEAIKANDDGDMTQKKRCRWRSTRVAALAVSVTKAKLGFDIDTRGWDSIVGAGRNLCKEPHVQH